MSLTVACVRVEGKYGREYVTKLREGVRRHLPTPHRFVCLTDDPFYYSDVEFLDIRSQFLEKWWAKMLLFLAELRGPDRWIYLDLDSVIIGDLSPLAYWDGTFGICDNFTRLAGHTTWPCRYGSCCMSFAPGWGTHVWNTFNEDRQHWMANCSRGDQQAIEAIVPNAAILQKVLPEGFFINYRDFTEKLPMASVAVFGGKRNPHNSTYGWVKENWI